MAKEKNISLAILGIVAVIAIVGLVMLLSGATGNAASNLYGDYNRYIRVSDDRLKDAYARDTLSNPQWGDNNQGIISQVTCDNPLYTRERSLARGADEVEGSCIPSPVDENKVCCLGSTYLNTQGYSSPSGYNPTGNVGLSQGDCFRLAAAYDKIMVMTLNRAGIESRDTVTINPCTQESEAGSERIYDSDSVRRDYAQVLYNNGDVWGVVGGLQRGNIQYAACAGGKARVAVSGHTICKTI